MTVCADPAWPIGSASWRPSGSSIAVTRSARSLYEYEPLANWTGAFSASTDWSMKTDEMYWWIIRNEGSSAHSWDAYWPRPQSPLYRKLPSAAPEGAVRATRMIELSGRFLPQS